MNPAVELPLTSRRIGRGEGYAVALSFLCFFCVLAAYYIIRPVREQLTASVGSWELPRFYAATLAVMLVMAPLFGALVSRYPRRVVMPVAYGVFIACLLLFAPLFETAAVLDPHALGMVFYVWVSVFNLFVVSVFWSFMADIWSEEQSRRLFPIIALAGTAGAVSGPALTRAVVGWVGLPSLLLISASLLAVALVCVMQLGRWAKLHSLRRDEANAEIGVGGSAWDGLKQIFLNPFVRSMALLLLLADGIGTVNYALVTDYSNQAFTDAVARTRFAANIDFWGNSLTAFAQLVITRWMLPRFGAGWVIFVWAAGGAAAMLLVVFTADPYAHLVGGLPAVAIALIISRGLGYGMAEPARHSLYARMARGIRYKGQNAVDTAVWRFGDVSIALGMNALRGIGLTVAGFAGLSTFAAMTAAWIGWRMSRRTPRAE